MRAYDTDFNLRGQHTLKLYARYTDEGELEDTGISK